MSDTICVTQPGLDEDVSRPDIDAAGNLLGVNDRGECRPVQGINGLPESWPAFLARYESWLAGFSA